MVDEENAFCRMMLVLSSSVMRSESKAHRCRRGGGQNPKLRFLHGWSRACHLLRWRRLSLHCDVLLFQIIRCHAEMLQNIIANFIEILMDT